MFSFFAWVSLIGGIISAVIDIIRYASSSDPLFFTSASYSLFMAFLSFAIYIRLSRMDKKIDDHSNDIKKIYTMIGDLKSRSSSEKKESKAPEQEAITATSPALPSKYDDHIEFVKGNIDNGRYPTDDKLCADVFAPKDWDENLVGSRDSWDAMYHYYEAILPILVGRCADTSIIDQICEEAYRLTGFIGAKLSGQNSYIMSYMCDIEQQTNGKSEALRRMCQKLDSIGILDRGRPFGERMK